MHCSPVLEWPEFCEVHRSICHVPLRLGLAFDGTLTRTTAMQDLQQHSVLLDILVVHQQVHERTIQGDFLMALLKRIIERRAAAGYPLKVSST